MSTKPKPKHGEQKDKPQKKKVRYQYPHDAISATDPLSKVIFFGRKFNADEKDALVTADMSLTMDQVSQTTFTFSDPGFSQARKGIFDIGIPVKYEDLFLDVATVDVTSVGGLPGLSVKCRPRIIRKLKHRRGPKVLKHASPSDFVRAECKAIGARYVIQDSAKRKQVARDHKKQKGQMEDPSSWTTFKRLADEEGFVVFESMNTIYFCKPSWLLDKKKDSAREVGWQTGDEAARALLVPACTRNEDTPDGQVTITLQLTREYGQTFRPGQALKLKGVPMFSTTYLVTQVDFSLLRDDYVTVTCGTPVDPTKSRVLKKGGSGGSHSTSSLRYLLQHAGFTGDGLEKAIAVCMATTGADADYENKEGRNTTWGSRVGLFAIRALNKPSNYDGLDAKRIRTKLLEAPYNAAFTYRLTNKGTNWSMFPAYTSGRYKQYFKTGKDYTVKGWSKQLSNGGSKGSGGGNSGATGQGTANAFVANALAQVGDRYVYGAETSIKDPNPSAFDCSELVQWAAGRAGVYIPDGSSAQIAFCHKVSVDTAIRTRGALLHIPGHIAISLGDGRTVEALNPGYGVVTMSATQRSFRWDSGGLIPGMRY